MVPWHSSGERWERSLIRLLLSKYEKGAWSSAEPDWPEDRLEGAVDAVVTLEAEDRSLAIEHTRIEPFVGEREDFYKHFAFLQDRLRADDTLKLPGYAIYVNFPVCALPHGSDWQGITQEVAGWIGSSHVSFSEDLAELTCPCPSHPMGELAVQASRSYLSDDSRSFLIVGRYGPIRLDDSVGKALSNKLKKLADAPISSEASIWPSRTSYCDRITSPSSPPSG